MCCQAKTHAEAALATEDAELKAALEAWLEKGDDPKETIAVSDALKAVLAKTEDASITMLSHEKFYPYCRPLMSKGRYHGFRHSDYAMFDDEWLEEKNITLRINTEITGLDLEEKTVTVNDGEKIPYYN